MRFLPLLAVACAGTLSAQVPDADIHLVPLSMDGGALKVGTPRNLTARAGYDNQPSFTPDGSAILFTAIHDDGQADIYRVNIADGAVSRLTSTPESEYSAIVTPDGRGFSVVRVERDSTQRLWRFPLHGGTPELVLERLKPVGYYVWGDSRTLFTFVLGEPATLQRAAAGDTAATVLAERIGRSLQRIPGERAVSVVLKPSPDEWWVARVPLAGGAPERLVRTPPGAEDHAWLPDGSLLMAKDNVLLRWTPGGNWTPVATFAEPGLARITRLAVSPDGRHLALVATPAPVSR